MNFRKVTIFLAALGLGIIGLYSLYWWSLAGSLQNAFIDWLGDRSERGYIASIGQANVGGFPFAITLDVQDLTLGGKAADGAAWKWQAQKVKIRTVPWQPTRYHLHLSGGQKLRFRNKGKLVAYRGGVKSLIVKTGLALDGYPTDASLSLVDLNLVSTSGAEPISAGKLKLKFQRGIASQVAQAPALEISFEAEGVVAPNFLRSPFGGTYKRVVLSARQLGKIENHRPLLSQIIEWRDQGGIVEVDHLALDHGPLVLSANGTLALDKNMQPSGAFTSRTFGFFEAVDRLKEKRMIKNKDATMAKLVLGLVSKTSGDGERRRLDLPITVQNSSVYTGPIRLARLAPVDWSFVKTIEAVLTP